jgi:ATP/maltotriose-dependent transcriptional regulator MalT
MFNRVYLTGVPAHAFDWECMRKDGERRFVEVSASLKKDIYGNPSGFMGIARDITERKKYLSELEAKENELEEKNKSLEEANTALNVVLKKVEENRHHHDEALKESLQNKVLPYLHSAKENMRDKHTLQFLSRMEENLNSLFAPSGYDSAPKFYKLTSAEIDVANFVMQGKRTKEIADILHVSPKAVEVHRNNLRRKFGLTNQKTCLRSHLLSLH